ncbi:hypothetical protein [Moellerella wisconsensis]|uniref:Uncharacterized protein n=2 Tax=Moellerella wisconsensis TaxID=158849 RepID=A0ACD3Y4H1_9GAMM|nr:hypothetical protein [Moellerella wisconsensis]KLN96757.1 hypothetical protein VK86_08785 [Moellerella wisconsensis]UNH22918.1 hypothetical protein MNY68_08505 [Moellerella wisconsensis]UNH26056.1 hypothetical protein MNY64_09075 [Moellerella wisconsensis]UNH29472.1 hypothetical protein MNY72_08640 [Moellerella wisconsensis]UNH37611.1 hypothetical protein MNY70_08655 [Moellerella wisconsensis]
MDTLVTTLVFGNDFINAVNPARLIPFKFEIYQNDQGFYHRMYKEVGMAAANLGQVYKVWAFEEQKSWEHGNKQIQLADYIAHCQDLYAGKVKD